MTSINLERRALGRIGLPVSCLGYGAFKIGRNAGAKYPRHYDLPTDDEADALLRAVVDELGINYIDAAPAYGLSEERVGRALGARTDVIISTKVGESFVNGRSAFDFSAKGVRESIARSRGRLRRQHLDLVFVHSDGDDLRVQQATDVVPTLHDLKQRGEIRAIGFSGKTVEGAMAALAWADALMIEFHQDNASHAGVIREAHAAGVAVIVKKGLASGRLPAAQAIRFVLGNPGVTSLVVGGLDLAHLRENVRSAIDVCQQRARRGIESPPGAG